MMERVVDGGLPFDGPHTAPLDDRRQGDLLLPYPDERLADGLQLGKFPEHQGDGFSHQGNRVKEYVTNG